MSSLSPSLASFSQSLTSPRQTHNTSNCSLIIRCSSANSACSDLRQSYLPSFDWFLQSQVLHQLFRCPWSYSVSLTSAYTMCMSHCQSTAMRSHYCHQVVKDLQCVQCSGDNAAKIIIIAATASRRQRMHNSQINTTITQTPTQLGTIHLDNHLIHHNYYIRHLYSCTT